MLDSQINLENYIYIYRTHFHSIFFPLNRYLRERKEAQQKELKAKTEASYPDCPEGHVPLPDHERKETLRLLKKSSYHA